MEDVLRLRRSEEQSLRNKELGIKPGPPKHVLTLNRPVYRALMARLGHGSQSAQAAALKVGAATVSGALEGKPIGGPFVAALAKLIAGTDQRLQDLVVPGDADTARKAA